MKVIAVLLIIASFPILWYWFEWREKVLVKIKRKHKSKYILEPHKTPPAN